MDLTVTIQVCRPTEEEKETLAGTKLLDQELTTSLHDPEYTPWQMVKSIHFWIFFIIFGLSRSVGKIFSERFSLNLSLMRRQ